MIPNTRESIIDTIKSDYVRIFELSLESTIVLERNLSNMSDEGLTKELDLIGVFYDSSMRTYQKGFLEIIHYEETEEKSQINTPIFNF